MESESGYILTEIWKARPSWLALSLKEREQFFREKIGPLIMSLIEQGAEFLGCAVNDNTGSERMDYRYMAVWRLPDKALSDKLEAAAKAAGFLDYFDQVNFSGRIIAPEVMNADMIQLDA
jgi:hypothetical protein